MYQKLQKMIMKMFRQTLYHRTNHPKPRKLLIIIKKERRDKLYTIHLHFGFFVFIIVNVQLFFLISFTYFSLYTENSHYGI